MIRGLDDAHDADGVRGAEKPTNSLVSFDQAAFGVRVFAAGADVVVSSARIWWRKIGEMSQDSTRQCDCSALSGLSLRIDVVAKYC
jgi:hypothetical protein